jgi:HMG (high mobility group) box
MTKDWAIPLGDVEAKVNRSAEQRQGEVHSKKNNGKVPRPMNSFMLYRSAYAERVKEYCKEGNHQIISQITGASWAMEPQEIKEMYEKYADLDRQNHQKAHPDYKFAPNKNGPASRKRKARDDDDDEPTDWEDRDYQGSSTYTKRTRYGHSVESRSLSSTPFEPMRQPVYGLVAGGHHMNRSSYEASNPRSVPPAYPVDVDDHYWEQWATPYGDNIENVHVRRVQHPGTISYGTMDDQSLVGLPLGGRQSQIQPQSGYGMPQPIHMNPLDPRLEQYGVHDPYLQYGMGGPANSLEPQQYDYGQEDVLATPQYEYPEASTHPGMATLTSPGATWNQPLPGADFDEELGRWSA